MMSRDGDNTLMRLLGRGNCCDIYWIGIHCLLVCWSVFGVQELVMVKTVVSAFVTPDNVQLSFDLATAVSENRWTGSKAVLNVKWI